MVNFIDIILNLEEKELNPKVYLPDNFYPYSDVVFFLEKFRELLKSNLKNLNEEKLKNILEESQRNTIILIEGNIQNFDPESENEIKERVRNFKKIFNIIKEEILNAYRDYLKNKSKNIAKYHIGLIKRELEK